MIQDIIASVFSGLRKWNVTLVFEGSKLMNITHNFEEKYFFQEVIPLDSPVESKHNQDIPSDAQCPNDKDKHGNNVVCMVGHINLAERAALCVCFFWLHALSRPHDSNTLTGLPTWQDVTALPVYNPFPFAGSKPP